MNESRQPLPRTVYVKVSTDLLAELSKWSEPLRVMVERQHDDTYDMVFQRVFERRFDERVDDDVTGEDAFGV